MGVKKGKNADGMLTKKVKNVSSTAERQHVSKKKRSPKSLDSSTTTQNDLSSVPVNALSTTKKSETTPCIPTKSETSDGCADAYVNTDMVRSGVAALLKLVTDACKNSKSKKELFEESEPVFLQISSFRVPDTPKRYIRFYLPHSLVTESTDICLFVKDLDKTSSNFEPSTEHFKNLLSNKGVTQITQVIPLKQLKTEYDVFTMKRRLCDQFDQFLSDDRVSDKVLKQLGCKFREKRKIPTPVNLNAKDLKAEVDRALSKTVLCMHAQGNVFLTTVGTTQQTEAQIVENILAVCAAFSDKLPGGWNNIQSLHIKTPKSFAVPIYMLIKSPNDVEVPVVPALRPKHGYPVTDEVSTMMDSMVTVYPHGDVFIHPRERNDYDRQFESGYLGKDEEEETEDEDVSEEEADVKEEEEKSDSLINDFHPQHNKVADIEVKKKEESDDDAVADAAEEAYLNEWKRKREDDDNGEVSEAGTLPKSKKKKKISEKKNKTKTGNKITHQKNVK